MPTEVIEYNAPVTIIDFAKHDNAVLRFYCKWGVNFLDEEMLAHTAPNRYFSRDCKFIRPDGSTVEGNASILAMLRNLHIRFAKMERESLRIVLLSDSDRDLHELQTTNLLSLWKTLDDDPICIPEAVYYEIGKAEDEEGAGTEGLQVRRMWHAYDKEMIAREEQDLEEMERAERAKKG